MEWVSVPCLLALTNLRKDTDSELLLWVLFSFFFFFNGGAYQGKEGKSSDMPVFIQDSKYRTRVPGEKE